MATDPKPWPYEGTPGSVLVDGRYQRSKSRAERRFTNEHEADVVEINSEAVENCVDHEVQTEMRGEDITLLHQELKI